MERQPVLAHINPLRQAGRDHIPADEALQAAQKQKTHAPKLHASVKPALHPENEEGNGESKTDQTAKKAVPPLPPIDELEFFKAHAAIDELVFGDLPVFFEFDLPLRFGERRKYPGDKLPLDDGKAGIRKTGRTANQDHRVNKKRDAYEPEDDPPSS